MPISNPTVIEEYTASGVGTAPFASYTPTSGDLLVCGGVYRTDVTADSVTTTYTDGGWTIINYGPYGTNAVRAYLAYAQYTSGTGTTTVTFSGNAFSLKSWFLRVPSGFNTTTPVPQNNGANDTTPGTSLTGNLGSTPGSGSLLIAVGGGYFLSGTTSADTSWTEADTAVTNGLPGNVQYVAGSNGTQFGIGFSGSPTDASVVLAMEIQEVAAATSNPGIEVVRTIPGVAH